MTWSSALVYRQSYMHQDVDAVAPTGTRTTRGAAKMGLRTETLVTPYVINQTLVRGRIWAFQTKSELMVQESAASDEVLLFFLK